MVTSLLWIVLVWCAREATSAAFTLSSSSLAPNYAKSTNSAYSFTMVTSQLITEAFDIRISYSSSEFGTMSFDSTSCSLLVNGQAISSQCRYDSTSNHVIFSSFSQPSGISNFTVGFRASTARYALTSSLLFLYYSPGSSSLSAISNNYVPITITNAPMACSWASSSLVVGSNTTYTISYSPTVTIQKDTIVQMSIQPWGPYRMSNFLTTTSTEVCAGACAITTPANNANISQLIRYTSLFPADTSSEGQLVLQKAKNPPSGEIITMSITMLAKISSTNSKSYMTCNSSLSVSTPNSFSSLYFSPSDATIGAQNVITLGISPTNPISSSTVILINPNGLSLTYAYNSYFPSGTQPSSSVQFDGTILISNLVSSSATSSPTVISLSNFTLQNPPYANKPVTLTFSTQKAVGSTYYAIDTGSVNIVCSPSTIGQAGLSLSDSGINVYATYTIWFVLVNSLTDTSFVRLTFPSQISTEISSCSLSTVSASCSVSNRSSLTIEINAASVPKATNLTLTVTNVLNPPTTTPTPTITIHTFYLDSQSLVDQLSEGSLLSVTATSVIVGGVSLQAASSKVGDTTTYTVNVQISNELPAGSIMKIKIPTLSYPLSNVILRSFAINGVKVSGCTLSTLGDLYVKLNEVCFPQKIPQFGIITVELANITNPSSTKPPNSWQIETLFNNLQMEYLQTGIVYTMDTPSDLLALSVSLDSAIVNAQNTYSFALSFQFAHYSGDRVIIELPDGVDLAVGFTCLPADPAITLTCTKNSAQKLLYVKVTLPPSTASFTSLSFNVTNFINNWYTSTRIFLIKTTTNESQIYYVEQGSQTVSYLPASLSATAVSDQRIILLGQSTIEITLVPAFTLSRTTNYSAVVLTAVVPSEFTPTAASCSLSLSYAACSISGQNIKVTGLNSFSQALTLSFSAATSYFAVQSSVFTITFAYNGSTISRNTTLRVSAFCANPCKECTSVPTECLSCLVQPYTSNNTYFVDEKTCLKDCPSTYFKSNGQCTVCNQASCYECSGTANNCTSCSGAKFLYLNSCLAPCPDTYYGDNNLCLSCKSPCLTCSSDQTCLTCINSYFLDVDSTCVQTCSLSDYIGLGGRCQKCTSNCETCSQSLSNCTSCDSQYLFLNNTCIRACPAGYFNNADSNCQICQSPCQTCTSISACTSCVPTYYLYAGSQCTQDCPNTTLAIVDTCEPCSEECATCSGSVSFCTSCSSSLLFYLNGCVETCPSLTYPYNKTCTTCIEPCLTCADSPSLCRTCVEGKYLLGTTCVNACPPNGYFTSGDECISCSNNCLYCSSVASCPMCSASYYLYNGGCVQECPESSPIVIDSECNPCGEECATCSGSTDNCTACTIYYFKYEYTCVKECPLAFYSNVQTYECEDGLTSRITFFPVLILVCVLTVIVIISKCFAPETSLPTALVALYSPFELIIWIYVLSLMWREFKEPGVNYTLPTVLLILAILLFFSSSIVFFFLNRRRVQSDEHAAQWCTNNLNYNVCMATQYLEIPLGLKLFRITYSRLFNAMPLSLVFKHRSNVFTLATVFSLAQILLCEALAVVALWFLIYNKSLKDQIFYSSIEGLIVTLVAVFVTLIDIYKPDDYFEHSEFSKIKKYVEKVKDSSFNKLEEGFDVSHDEGSQDAEYIVGLTGNKLMYSKENPNSFKDLYFEDCRLDDASEGIATEALDFDKANEESTQKKRRRINIFSPIVEEQEEYLDDQKFDEAEAHTQLELQKMNKRVKTYESEEETDPYRMERKIEMGTDEPFDDKQSLIGDRSIKKRWNDFMTKRKELIGKITKNTFKFSNKKDFLEEEQQPKRGMTAEIERGSLQTPAEESGTRRRRKRRRESEKNKELEEIYLQRLSEKKPRVNRELFSSEKVNRFDF